MINYPKSAIMKAIYILAILLWSVFSYGQAIQSAEYFFDTDPGVGNATALPVGSASDTINFSGAIATTGLSAGHHHLYVRVKNTQGVWSHYFSRVLYIKEAPTTPSPRLFAAEYFYNTDPGTGNGNNIPSSAFPDDTVNISTSVATTGLTGGWDTLHVRVKDSLGVWSMTMAQPFLICTNRVATPIISGGLQTCSGDTLHLAASAVTGAISYLWTGPNNFSATGQNIAIANATATNAGLYTVRAVRTGGSGCDTSVEGTATIVINPVSPSPTVSISSNPAGAVCAGTAVTFTATSANAGSTYQWFVGNTLQSATGNAFTATPANNDQIRCVVSSNAVCVNDPTDTSNIITVVVNPVLTPSISIVASQDTVCAGTAVSFTATATHGGNSPAYQWKVNNNNVGTNSATYSFTPANGDVVSCELTSSEACANPAAVTSAGKTITVNPVVTPTLHITSGTSNPVCANTAVSFTATATHVGTTNVYEWKINGNIQASTTGSFTHNAWMNNDQVTCTIVSDEVCAMPITASDSFDVIVTPSVAPSVSINANPGVTINPGTQVLFTATPLNAGTNPDYQWRKNGVAISGETSNTYTTNTLQNNDAIDVIIYSKETCPDPDSAISNILTISIITTNVTGEATISGLSVYPNPNHGTFTLSGTVYQSENIQLSLVNTLGQTVHQEEVNISKSNFNHLIKPRQGLTSGIYFLNIKTAHQTTSYKVIVQ